MTLSPGPRPATAARCPALTGTSVAGGWVGRGEGAQAAVLQLGAARRLPAVLARSVRRGWHQRFAGPPRAGRTALPAVGVAGEGSMCVRQALCAYPAAGTAARCAACRCRRRASCAGWWPVPRRGGRPRKGCVCEAGNEGPAGAEVRQRRACSMVTKMVCALLASRTTIPQVLASAYLASRTTIPQVLASTANSPLRPAAVPTVPACSLGLEAALKRQNS